MKRVPKSCWQSSQVGWLLSWIQSPGVCAVQNLKTNHRENAEILESQEMRSCPALIADPTYLGLTGAPPLTAESSGSWVSAPLVATPCPQGRRNSGIFFQQFIQALDISSNNPRMSLPALIKHLKPQCKAATWNFLIGC
ncbi:uncharacterized protein LOC120890497 [Ictidomys tridecemlineatus]